MSLLPNLNVVIVNALNRANAVTVVDPKDIEILSISDGGDANTPNITVVVQGIASRPNYGTYSCNIQRISLDSFFEDSYRGLGKSLAAPAGCNDIKTLLSAIGYPIGFAFPDNIIEDGPIIWVDGKASVTLQAVAGNGYFYGSVVLSLTISPPKELSSIMTRNFITSSAQAMTDEQFYLLVEAGNACPLPREFFQFGPPQTLAEAGVTHATYNSVVRITPTVASGYTGYYDIFFNRINLGSHDGKSAFVPDDASGKLFDVLDSMSLAVGVTSDELVNSDIDWTESPATCLISAKPSSYRAYGEGRISLLRYSDDIHETTINYTINSVITAVDFSNRVASQVSKAGRLVVNLNILPGVVLSSSLLTEPVFKFTKMPNYGEILIKLKNEGIIVGRGSTSGQTTVTQAGGNGIIIDASFNGSIEINNLGIIAGGGGGGSSPSVYLSGKWYNAYGGGGQALGQASNNSGSGNYPGINGTLTAPGAGRSFSVGNTFLASGAGGGPGEPGYFGYSMDTASVPYIYLEEKTSFPWVQLPGKSISGALDKITFINKGIVRPNLISPLIAFTEYLLAQGYDRYDSSKAPVHVVDKTKPFVVDFAASPFGPNGALNYPLGSCWGSVPGEGTTLAKALVHGYPHLSAIAIGFLIAGNVALVEFGERISVDFKTTVMRNNISAAAQSNKINGYPIKRLVYYDRYLDEVMECNPYLMTEPVKWVPPS